MPASSVDGPCVGTRWASAVCTAALRFVPCDSEDQDRSAVLLSDSLPEARGPRPVSPASVCKTRHGSGRRQARGATQRRPAALAGRRLGLQMARSAHCRNAAERHASDDARPPSCAPRPGRQRRERWIRRLVARDCRVSDQHAESRVASSIARLVLEIRRGQPGAGLPGPHVSAQVSALSGGTKVHIAWNSAAIASAGDRSVVAWSLRTRGRFACSPTVEPTDGARRHATFDYGRPLGAATPQCPHRDTDRR